MDNIFFDLQSPAVLLAQYKFLLRKQKKNTKVTLMSSATRLIKNYMALAKEYEAVKVQRKTIGGWLKFRSRAIKLKQGLLRIKDEIANWFSKTIRYFVAYTLKPIFIGVV